MYAYVCLKSMFQKEHCQNNLLITYAITPKNSFSKLRFTTYAHDPPSSVNYSTSHTSSISLTGHSGKQHAVIRWALLLIWSGEDGWLRAAHMLVETLVMSERHLANWDQARGHSIYLSSHASGDVSVSPDTTKTPLKITAACHAPQPKLVFTALINKNTFYISGQCEKYPKGR